MVRSAMRDRPPKVQASARKNTFWHTFVRFSVLLTITRDPLVIPANWRVETLTEGGIFFAELYKRNRINFNCIEAII